MRESRVLAILAIWLAQVVAVPGAAQEKALTPVGEGSATTLHSQSQLVLVDVVVKHRREPIKGLTASDFILLEDGKPQTIAFLMRTRLLGLPPALSTKADSQTSSPMTRRSRLLR